MSTVIQFPLAGSDEVVRRSALRRHVGAALLDEPPARAHVAQFYDNDDFLIDAVGHFLVAGLKSGDSVVTVATAPHLEGLARHLEAAGFKGMIESGRVTLLDARETLSKFMVGEAPDTDLFRQWIGRVMAEATSGVGLRVFGEMVDLLWREGNSRAAIRLEELWNEAGKAYSFTLLCAYVMGNFYKQTDQASFSEVCRNHSHVIPTEEFAHTEDSNARLREISLLQQRARALESEIQHRRELESALRDALGERRRAEEELRTCIVREREARERAEASDAFKEIFLGILGHDLRNPLSTVLTTARLMRMRGELPADSEKRLDRVISSGVRMQRMIEQLLDLTGARLAGGIVVSRTKQDLIPLVSKIVDEVRVASPGRAIELQAEGRCEACVDGDRFEQVVSNLLGNAVSHGASDKPIVIVIAARADVVSLSVHNYGTPIDQTFMPLLFDPFKRGEKPHGRSSGLGLGLYISERIVNAHGGKIEVESSQEMGTRFEAIFPRNG